MEEFSVSETEFLVAKTQRAVRLIKELGGRVTKFHEH